MRNPFTRSLTGYYKVARTMKGIGLPLQVFADSRLTLEAYLHSPEIPSVAPPQDIYAVAKGRHATSPDLYYDIWASAFPHVTGVPGAV